MITALLAFQSILHCCLCNVSKLSPQLNIVDGLVVKEATTKLDKRVPHSGCIVVPSSHRAELRRTAISFGACILLQPSKHFAAQLQDFSGKQLAGPSHFLALSQLRSHSRGQQENCSA